MEKGQSSFDMLLAFVAAILFASTLAIYAQDFSSASKEIAARSELRGILLDVYATIGNVKAYDMNMTYISQTLRVSQDPELECRIVLDRTNSDINVIAGDYGEVFTGILLTDIEVRKSGALQVGDVSFACGEQVEIVRA